MNAIVNKTCPKCDRSFPRTNEYFHRNKSKKFGLCGQAKIEGDGMKYKVEITETLQRIVEIEARDENGAVRAVAAKYTLEEIILDSEDFSNVTFRVFSVVT